MAAVKPRSESIPPAQRPPEARRHAVVRFAGDSGDGMQLAGAQFTIASAHAGNAVFTLPDFPAEIRAPAGALAGVSAFTIHVGDERTATAGDRVDVLLVMHPAALRMHAADVAPHGLILANADAFHAEEWEKAGYRSNPLEDGTLRNFRVLALPIDKLNRAAVAQVKLSPREIERCRNFFALGLVYWLFDRPQEPTLRWIRAKYAKNPAVLEANGRSLRAGYQYGETHLAETDRIRVARAPLPAGKYRELNGVDGLMLGLVAAAHKADVPLVFASCPSHPATELLHAMAQLTRHDVRCPQAEDEVAALGMALGASFGGALGVTATSSPGLSQQSEMLGLAVMAELPCVIIDLQRGGPSTGLPTKTEQADLLQALVGRHGECPLVVVAASSPADCFTMAYEAVRLALRYMTPVVLLSDLYLTLAAEPWRIRTISELPSIEVNRPTNSAPDGSPFLPYRRDRRLARPWAAPGTPGLEHRIGGLEKDPETGHVSYDPANHQEMVRLRAEKIAGIAAELPPLVAQGPESGELLVLGWGSTEGAIAAAVERAQSDGFCVAAAHLHYLHPLPPNSAEVLRRYKKILIPELNGGQLALWLQAQLHVTPISFTKLQGQPFRVSEIEAKIREVLRTGGS